MGPSQEERPDAPVALLEEAAAGPQERRVSRVASARGQSASWETADEVSPSLYFWEVPYGPGKPPLEVKHLLESNPLKSRFSVCELTVC